MLKDGSNWKCLICNHSSNRKSSVYYHVEAKHTASSGFSCHLCTKFCPTTNALRTHLSRQHRQNIWNIFEWFYEINIILSMISFSIWGSDKVKNVIIQRWGWILEVPGLWVQDKKQLSIVWTHWVPACWPSGLWVWHLLQVLLHTECSQKSQIIQTQTQARREICAK